MTSDEKEIIYCPRCGAEGDSILIEEYKPKPEIRRVSMDEWANKHHNWGFTGTTCNPVRYKRAVCKTCGYTVRWTEEYYTWIALSSGDDYNDYTNIDVFSVNTYTEDEKNET